MEDLPNLFEGVDQAIDVLLVVVEGHARATGGVVLHPELEEERLGAVVAGAEG